MTGMVTACAMLRTVSTLSRRLKMPMSGTPSTELARPAPVVAAHEKPMNCTISAL